MAVRDLLLYRIRPPKGRRVSKVQATDHIYIGPARETTHDEQGHWKHCFRCVSSTNDTGFPDTKHHSNLYYCRTGGPGLRQNDGQRFSRKPRRLASQNKNPHHPSGPTERHSKRGTPGYCSVVQTDDPALQFRYILTRKAVTHTKSWCEDCQEKTVHAAFMPRSCVVFVTAGA